MWEKESNKRYKTAEFKIAEDLTLYPWDIDARTDLGILFWFLSLETCVTLKLIMAQKLVFFISIKRQLSIHCSPLWSPGGKNGCH